VSGPTVYVEGDTPLEAMILALAALGHRDIKVRPHGTSRQRHRNRVAGSDGRGVGRRRRRCSEGVAVSQ
jgi:hypothetical protein